MARRRSNGPFVAKGAPVAKAAPDSPAGGGTAAFALGLAQQQQIAGPRLRDLELYFMLATKHPHVSACISLIADAIAAEGYSLAPSDGESAKPLSVDDDPRVGDIREFFRVAFMGLTFRQAMVATAGANRTYGVAYLRKHRATIGNKSQLTGLEWLDPRTVKAQLAPDKKSIEKYLIAPRSLIDSVFATQINQIDSVPVTDMVALRLPGGDPIFGMPSPLESLDLTLAHDLASRKWREAFFRHGAKPGTVLVNKQARRDQIEATEAMIKRQRTGVDGAFVTWVLSGDWVMLETSKSGDNDIDFVKGAQMNREDICSVYRVPVGMLTFSGTALGSAGKGDDRDFFEEFAVLPLEELIYETLTMSVLHDEFGITDLHMVPKRRDRVRLTRFDAAVKLVKFGGTGNEARSIVGLPPITDPKYDMDAPLFVGVSTMGFEANEATDTPPPTPDGEGAGAVGDAADGAQQQRDEVAHKGAARFRRTRTQGRRS